MIETCLGMAVKPVFKEVPTEWAGLSHQLQLYLPICPRVYPTEHFVTAMKAYLRRGPRLKEMDRRE